jgi:hypothetical protein
LSELSWPQFDQLGAAINQHLIAGQSGRSARPFYLIFFYRLFSSCCQGTRKGTAEKTKTRGKKRNPPTFPPADPESTTRYWHTRRRVFASCDHTSTGPIPRELWHTPATRIQPEPCASRAHNQPRAPLVRSACAHSSAAPLLQRLCRRTALHTRTSTPTSTRRAGRYRPNFPPFPLELCRARCRCDAPRNHPIWTHRPRPHPRPPSPRWWTRITVSLCGELSIRRQSTHRTSNLVARCSGLHSSDATRPARIPSSHTICLSLSRSAPRRSLRPR